MLRKQFQTALTLSCGTLLLVTGIPKAAHAQHSRKTPVTEAVEKTRDSIVTVKVERQGNWGRRSEVGGTGVIIDYRGYIVTNDHVVAGCDKVSVQLADSTEITAKVFAEDAAHDLAVLSVSTSRHLAELALGPASDVRVGETVVAVGQPYGYTDTVSTGIVSAKGRDIPTPSGNRLTNLIQTSANLNPGNSGGPMLNVNGELIGINVAVREGAQGIAFALDADTVQRVLSKHLSAARIAKVGHGLVCSENVVAEQGDDRQQVVVDSVDEKSPAAAAGVKAGDVLVKVGDRKVANRFDVERAMWNFKAGDELKVSVLRDGKEVTLSLTLSRTPANDKAAQRGVFRRLGRNDLV